MHSTVIGVTNCRDGLRDAKCAMDDGNLIDLYDSTPSPLR